MAYPFGGHPKFSRMIERLQALACICVKSDGSMVGPDGPVTVWLVNNTINGRFLVLPDMGADEYLSPSMVAYIERRLDVETGFASTPH